MVSLLRAAGYEAVMSGVAFRLTAAQLVAWLGVDATNVCAATRLLGAGHIPIAPRHAALAGADGVSAALG